MVKLEKYSYLRTDKYHMSIDTIWHFYEVPSLCKNTKKVLGFIRENVWTFVVDMIALHIKFKKL